MKKLIAFVLVAIYGLSSLAGLWMFVDEGQKAKGDNSVVISTLDNKQEVVKLGEEDMELLARTVYGEARGESFDGQVAVAAVILNRMKSPEFPDRVEDVVFEPLAFTAVSDGQINLGYDDKAYLAVEKALEGKDPSGGALYYYNPIKSTSDWIWSRKVIRTIGDHHFAL